eukprot:CAMPEP_0113638432 /NCGR_PEP_ID=MMETSP0017_2-20120614/20131_1 /TAXON_ID=2856 /ORGANISM="Cylindrotheca closterium" /LENGTH=762 /DNA_ID=CAMNT_0000549535 /DNA_START=367 /DNA_END=2655 /DNA_ORIENTATION=- /assembly_acc=CAM_ASM_000147
MDNNLRDRNESSFRGAELKLFVRNVDDPQKRKRPITVRSWSCIKDIKDVIHSTINFPPHSQRLFFGPLMTSGRELPNHRTLHDAGIYKSGETLLLKVKDNKTTVNGANKSSTTELNISASVENVTPRLMKGMVNQARRALTLGLKPELVLDGSGGTYFLHDPRKSKIAVFKPADEEPYAENNPRGYLPQPDQSTYLREGIVPGEACIREVAAFILDHEGFSDVPMTTLVEARHPNFSSNGSKLNCSQGGASIGAHSILNSGTSSNIAEKKVGSLQEFVRTECSMDDISPSMISVEEVHKIAVLDIRLLNADRNAANLLCRRRSDNSLQLIPIDHGFCLRASADVSWMDWCWLDWPQLKQPVSKATRDYIMRLDIEEDVKTLQENFNLDQKAIDYFCASSRLLKLGINKGLTLYEIACMCCRNDDLGELPSRLEALFSMAADLAELAIENGRWHHSAASKALTEQIAMNTSSLLGTPRASSKMRKVASSVEFGQATNGLAGLQLMAKDETLPGMVNSSASDSSSDTCEVEEGERDETEQWAADVVLDVSMDKSMSIAKTRTGRSMSIESDGSNDSSNQGFWEYSPRDESDDDDDRSWSSSSDESTDEQCIEPGSPPSPDKRFRRLSMTPAFNAKIPKDAMSYLSIPSYPRAPSKVTFDPETVEFDPVPSDDVDDNPTQPLEVPEIPERQDFKMHRSQSYNGLSSASQIAKAPNDLTELNKPRPDHEELYRKYFTSFVETVINQEATAAAAKLANHRLKTHQTM